MGLALYDVIDSGEIDRWIKFRIFQGMRNVLKRSMSCTYIQTLQTKGPLC